MCRARLLVKQVDEKQRKAVDEGIKQCTRQHDHLVRVDARSDGDGCVEHRQPLGAGPPCS
eukprot:4822032-Prymnesium_polylepis.5